MRPSRLSYAFHAGFLGALALAPLLPFAGGARLAAVAAVTTVSLAAALRLRTESFAVACAASLGALIALIRLSIAAGGPPESDLPLPFDRLRAALEARMGALYPEPHGSLLAGLLLGSRDGLPRETIEEFRAAGLTHVLAVSGYNVTMLTTTLSAALFWLPLRWRLVPSLGIVAGFTLLAGGSASAVRAAIMGGIGLVAVHAGRQAVARLTTLWAAFAMLAWNPSYLRDDAGFQLSFLALLGIQEIAPILREKLGRIPEAFGLREALCVTLSAQLATSPWVLYLFGELSLVAPLSNLLGPPAIPAGMLFGVASLAAGELSTPLGRLIAAVGWLPLEWMLLVARAASALPFASLRSHAAGAPVVTALYAALAWWTLTSRTGKASDAAAPTGTSRSRPARVPATGTNAK